MRTSGKSVFVEHGGGEYTIFILIIIGNNNKSRPQASGGCDCQDAVIHTGAGVTCPGRAGPSAGSRAVRARICETAVVTAPARLLRPGNSPCTAWQEERGDEVRTAARAAAAGQCAGFSSHLSGRWDFPGACAGLGFLWVTLHTKIQDSSVAYRPSSGNTV